MRLGPRVALVTTLVMAGVLGAATWAVLRVVRAELEREIERQARDTADAVAAGLEPLRPADAETLLAQRVTWASRRGSAFVLETIAVGGKRPSNAWAGLVEAAARNGAPVGRLFDGDGQRPFYAMAIPLHNELPGNPSRQAVAFLGLMRDAAYIDAQLLATARRIVPIVLVGGAIFGVLVYFLLLGSVVTPLRRLVDAIDAVAKGDFSRALLPHRDDEIGTLAGRFNAMTNNLREARAEEARATAARLALETRLRHSEKLATIGQMAAEIAHEVGTPLNVIGGRARSIARRPGEAADAQKNAEIIGAQVDRITKIIRQVLDFSRKSRPTLTQVDVGRVVGEALDFASEIIRRQRVAVEVNAAPGLPVIPGDPDEIQQVCLNLVGNAVHAMPDGGKLTVTVDRVIRRKEGLALAPPAPFLLLEVADTGAGVPPADRERIFEAFFTTKETGEGTGLGLAVSKGIVKDHDGWIEVDDRPGGGAVFRVFLPVAGEPAALDEGAATDPGTGRVTPAAALAITDEPPLPARAGSARIE